MCKKLLESLEENLKKRYRAGLIRKKKEKYILIKMDIIGVARIFMRVMFYFLLIFGAYLLTTLMPIIKSPNVYFGFAFFVIITIVLYEELDHIFEENYKRLRDKSHRVYGSDYNKKRF